MIVKGLDKMLSLDVRGKIGWTGGFGRISFGYNRFGFHSEYFGIYSKKLTLKGKQLSRMKYYRPTNSQMLAQQNWRAVHAYATSIWQSFDPETKEPYKIKAKRLKMEGYNLFLKNFLSNKPHGFGDIKYGYGF